VYSYRTFVTVAMKVPFGFGEQNGQFHVPESIDSAESVVVLPHASYSARSCIHKMQTLESLQSVAPTGSIPTRKSCALPRLEFIAVAM